MSDARLSECSARVIGTRVMHARVMHARAMRGEGKPRGDHMEGSRHTQLQIEGSELHSSLQAKAQTLLFNFQKDCHSLYTLSYYPFQVSVPWNPFLLVLILLVKVSSRSSPPLPTGARLRYSGGPKLRSCNN